MMRATYEYAIMHNGKLPWRSTVSLSDTRCFVDDILEPAFRQNPFAMGQPYFLTLLQGFVGPENKLCVMRYDAESDKTSVTFINHTTKPAHMKYAAAGSPTYSYDYERDQVANNSFAGIDVYPGPEVPDGGRPLQPEALHGLYLRAA